MPVFSDISISGKGRLGIWKITENIHFFSERLSLSANEQEEYQKIKKHYRRLEWLAARWLLHSLTGTENKRFNVKKDQYGKPSFDDHVMSFSLSHSVNYVAALISDKTCGLDLQVFDERILKLSPKFLSDKEMKLIKPHSEIIDATRCWTIKEAVYKAYGKRQLDFKKDMKIETIEGNSTHFKATATLDHKKQKSAYEIVGYGHNLYIATTAYEI
jgi:phosphopantetheinyl transferase